VRSSRHIELIAVGPEFLGQSWKSDSLLRVGRVNGVEVKLEHSSISRHHAEIAWSEEGWVVRDLGSTNGTLLNGVRIGQAARELRPGDAVKFGKVAMSVSFYGQEDKDPGNGSQSQGSQSQARRPTRAVAGPSSTTVIGLPRANHDIVIQTVTALAQAVELRDKYTGGHTQRVTTYALLLADRLGLSPQDRRLLQIGVPLHDIGKIGVDDAVLRKPGLLTVEEFESLRSHTIRGAEILTSIPDLEAVLPIVRSHHERWDGRGYPDGLAGDAIPLLSRVVAVADAFDAMTSDRPYRKSLPLFRAFAELGAQAGAQFDPRCAHAFMELRTCISELLRQRQSQVPTNEFPAVNLDV
jgi:putative nucleotidyltransferase with HDIG domain